MATKKKKKEGQKNFPPHLFCSCYIRDPDCAVEENQDYRICNTDFWEPKPELGYGFTRKPESRSY